VWGGQQLAEIPRLEEMEAEVFVLEADAGGLAPELSAAVWLEAHQQRAYTATVTHVDALAKRKKRWVPLQYFGVILELERTDPELMKPGQRVRAELRLDQRDEALVVPREAVFERDGNRVVYRQSGFGFEPVEVVAGPATLGRVVIEQGLDEGDLIALADPTDARAESEPSESNGGVEGALQ
jgi:multidrug efflux pump subunit AcrA (membrane-fusion protein)